MGFLHKLWDETLAGPAPESGLGKLRKYNSFSAVRSAPPTPAIVSPDQTPVSRSITILRSNSSAGDPGSAPVSPAGPSTPTSPFSPANTPRGDIKRKTRRKATPENTDPVVYDWIVINALDR